MLPGRSPRATSGGWRSFVPENPAVPPRNPPSALRVSLLSFLGSRARPAGVPVACLREAGRVFVQLRHRTVSAQLYTVSSTTEVISPLIRQITTLHPHLCPTPFWGAICVKTLKSVFWMKPLVSYRLTLKSYTPEIVQQEKSLQTASLSSWHCLASPSAAATQLWHWKMHFSKFRGDNSLAVFVPNAQAAAFSYVSCAANNLVKRRRKVCY